VLVSASEDKTVRVWDPRAGKMVWSAEYKAAARCLACTGPTAASHGHSLMVCGYADGSAWFYDLNDLKAKPRLLAQRGQGEETSLAHKGAVTCVAFSPDGSLCVTGGEDKSIAVWDAVTGKYLNRVSMAHRTTVTSLQFAPGHSDPLVLVSAGGDQTASVWKLETGKPPMKILDHNLRGGDVAQLGTDGRHLLFDKGKELLLLGLEDRRIHGTLRNTSGISGFTTFALFSPDGRTILTNGAADNRLQLWRTPTAGGRGAELRQFVWSRGPVTCAAFSPDGNFVVTGTQDNQVLVWAMPGEAELTEPLLARITLNEKVVESGSRQVRVWADLEKTPDWLTPTPGSSAKIIIPPVTQR
jgi:WD40 repeat protein